MRQLFSSCLVVLSAVLISACDQMTPVMYVNSTGEELAFFSQSDVETALLGSGYVPAGSSFENWLVPANYRTLRVAASKEDGQWVFDHNYTRDELEKQMRRIVVSSLEPIPPPIGVAVLPSSRGGGTPIALPLSTGTAPTGVKPSPLLTAAMGVAPPSQASLPVAPPVTLANRTHERLEFYAKSDVQEALTHTASVDAGSSWETPDPRSGYGTITGSFNWLRVAVTKQDGQWVFDHTFGWSELQNAKRTIVVSSLEPIAPPSNVRVAPSPGVPPPVLASSTSGVAPTMSPSPEAR